MFKILNGNSMNYILFSLVYLFDRLAIDYKTYLINKLNVRPKAFPKKYFAWEY